MTKHQNFLEKLLLWYKDHQRTLPFRGLKDPYKIWVSEVLLQQTQMSRGIEYYERFIQRFPTVLTLAQTSWEDFLPFFQGLGYYNRGRNMLKAAQVIVAKYHGIFPRTKEELTKIPGIGSYTADAILSFAYNHPTLTLDTNVQRILGRVFVGEKKLDATSPAGAKVLATTAKSLDFVPSREVNQALMDHGSLICLSQKPRCLECPFQKMCLYFKAFKPHLSTPPKKVVREKYDLKFPMAVIMLGKQALLYDESLLGGELPKGDEREFLKNLAREKLGVEISVRPSYETWIKAGIKYSLHRCYILLGAEKLAKNKHVGWH